MKQDNNTTMSDHRSWGTFKRFINEKKIIIDSLIVLVVTLLSFIQAFSNYSVMEYRDGGYYYLQVQTLLSSGKLYYEAPPFFFLIAAMFGNIEIGISIAGSLMVALQVPSYFVALYIFRGRKEAYITLPFTFWSWVFQRLQRDLMKNLTSIIFIPLVLAFLWWLWKEKKKFFVILAFLLLSTFCMVTSHLPTALVGLLSSGTLVILLLLDVITKKPKEIVTQLKEIKTKILNKEFRLLLNNNLIRIGLGLITIVIGTVLGFAVNAIFPVQPLTWYTSSDLPSTSYGNAETTVLSLFRFFAIFSNQLVITIIAFCLLIIFRPKGWQIPLSILLSVLAIDFTISSQTWNTRLDMNLEVGRIILAVILAGSIIDFIAKEDRFDKLKSLKRKEKTKRKVNLRREKRIKQIFTRITILALIIFFSMPFINMGVLAEDPPGYPPNPHPVMTTEERVELSLLGETLLEDYNISDCIIYARHGLEFWVTVETGFECKSTTTQDNFIEFMDVISKESRTVFFVISSDEPLIINRVPLITPPSEPISGPWGQINTPHPQAFFGDNNYTVEMLFSPKPGTTIKNATSNIWVSYGPDNQTFLCQELLNVQPINPTTSLISNQNSSNLAEICKDYNFLLLSIIVNFEEQSTPPFAVQFPVLGGVAPFEFYQEETYYRTLKIDSSFKLADEGYPDFPSSSDKQEDTNQDLFSMILLWPYSAFKGFYPKLIVAYPMSIMQSYTFYLIIKIIAIKIRKRIKIKKSSKNNQFSEETS